MRYYTSLFIGLFTFALSLGSPLGGKVYDDFEAYMERSQAYFRGIKPDFDQWGQYDDLEKKATALKTALTLNEWAEGFTQKYSFALPSNLNEDDSMYGKAMRGLYAQVTTIFDQYMVVLKLAGDNHEAAEAFFGLKKKETKEQQAIATAFGKMMQGHSAYQKMFKGLQVDDTE